MWLTAKCCLVQNEAGKNKYSCKGVSKKHNGSPFQCYNDILDVFLKTRRDSELEREDIDKAKNVGFKIYDHGMVTCEQNKLGSWPMSFIQSRFILEKSFFNHPSKMFS